MAWPKGVSRKPIIVENLVPVKLQENGIHYDVILAVRSLRNGPFKGLWELVELDLSGKRIKVLTDANSRQMIINLMTKKVLRLVIGASPQ
jgi:hypothetical protein